MIPILNITLFFHHVTRYHLNRLFERYNLIQSTTKMLLSEHCMHLPTKFSARQVYAAYENSYVLVASEKEKAHETTKILHVGANSDIIKTYCSRRFKYQVMMVG